MNIALVLVNICALAIATAMCSFAGASDGFSQFQGGTGQSEFISDPIVNRVRREAPPMPPKDPWNMCCNVEKPAGADALMEKAKASFTECSKEAGAPGPKVLECIAKKHKMVDDAGNLNEAGIKAMFNELPLGEHQKAIKDASITACIAKVKAIPAADLVKKLQEFNMCMAKDFMNACPKDKQDNSDKCKNMREGKFQ